MLPTLPGLEAFEAVARTGSFTRAAKALHVTQSAVSHRVKALETQLGCALFVRRGKRVELTEEGRALAGQVVEAFRLLREGVARVEGVRASGVLTLSCSPSLAIRWLVPRLPDFSLAHPEIEVRLSATDTLVTPGEGGIDACLRYGGGDYPGLACTSLGEEWITPVANPIIAARLKRPADLAREVLLHDEVLRDHPGWVGWARWLAAAKASKVDARRGPRFSHAHMALEAAIAGQGVALGRTTLVEADLASGRLIAPFSQRLESGLAYWLLTREGDATPRVAAFRAWITEDEKSDAKSTRSDKK